MIDGGSAPNPPCFRQMMFASNSFNFLIKKTFLHHNSEQRDLVFICHDVRECNNKDFVTKPVADCLPKQVLFFNTPLAPSDAHAFGFLLKHVTGKIEKLLLWNCSLRASSFVFICDAIKEMPGTVS